MNIIFTVVFSVLSLFSGRGDHALYISVFEVSVEQEQITVEVKVFSNDLYDVLYNMKGDALKSSPELLVEKEVEDYFSKHIRIDAGGAPTEFDLIQISREGESYFLRFSSNFNSSIEVLHITADYLFELFPTQRNILKLKNGDIQKHHIFQKSSPEYTVRFPH